MAYEALLEFSDHLNRIIKANKTGTKAMAKFVNGIV
jgi:hypothetical protein